MKKRIGVILVCILLIVSSLVIVFPIKAIQFNPNILYVGGSGPGNYTRIQDAINASSNGDTVFVYDDSSPYIEVLTIDKTINLIGEDRNSTMIRNSVVNGSVIYIIAEGVTISGFFIKNIDAPKYNFGISVYSNNNLISNNIISAEYGIILKNADSNLIINNNLLRDSSTGAGISIVDSYQNYIRENFIEGFFSGMKFYDCVSIHWNYIVGNEIHCLKNRYGIFIYYNCTHFEIYGNNITGCFDEDGSAIYSESGYNIFHHNNIENNLNGIELDGSSGIIHHNNFISNQNDAIWIIPIKDIIGNIWYNNYWGKTILFPKIIPGKIQIPKYPFYYSYRYVNWFKFDLNPAKEPYDIP